MNSFLGQKLCWFLSYASRFQTWRANRWLDKLDKIKFYEDKGLNTTLDHLRAEIYFARVNLWLKKSNFTLEWARMCQLGIWPDIDRKD